MLRRAVYLLCLCALVSAGLALAPAGAHAAGPAAEPVRTPAVEQPTGVAVSQAGDATYKRLTRTIRVPVDGAELSFRMARDTEPGWDFVFVEARTAGGSDWTTLPDRHGHTSQDTGLSCPFWHQFHPFLSSYQQATGEQACAPKGRTGAWWAASGSSAGFESWSVDLSAYAGRDVEVSISYASDDVVQGDGVQIDDIIVSTGEGTTSFEGDGDALGGWSVPGPPAGSAPNRNDWVVRD
jgi:hypothetical protein